MDRARACDILGLNDTEDFDATQIKKAFNKKALQEHPDKWSSEASKTAAAGRFVLCLDARNFLLNRDDIDVSLRPGDQLSFHIDGTLCNDSFFEDLVTYLAGFLRKSKPDMRTDVSKFRHLASEWGYRINYVKPQYIDERAFQVDLTKEKMIVFWMIIFSAVADGLQWTPAVLCNIDAHLRIQVHVHSVVEGMGITLTPFVPNDRGASRSARWAQLFDWVCNSRSRTIAQC